MRKVEMPQDFAAWRERAKELLVEGVPPAEVLWSSEPALDLWERGGACPQASVVERVPKAFLALAEDVACFRDEAKWDVLYRLLWRLLREGVTWAEVGMDEDYLRCRAMVKSIHRDCHKMKAFVRFREGVGEDGEAFYVSWFEPEHLIVRRMASFFVKRFAGMRWSILTPDACAHWQGGALFFSKGVTRQRALAEDDWEELWRVYYQNIFNAARLKRTAMLSEMPMKYWKNLPEAEVIEGLIVKGGLMDVSWAGWARDIR